MPADPAPPGRDDGGRDERLEDAWAQIVADYDRAPADVGSTAPWPAVEDLPVDTDDDGRSDAGRSDVSSRSHPASRTDEPGDDDGHRDDLRLPADPAAGAGHEPGADQGHWTPPPPPPLPRPVGATGAAWLALILGPLVLLVSTVSGWRLPPVLTAVCVIGFVGGLVFLIVAIDDDQRRDGWDDGAQV